MGKLHSYKRQHLSQWCDVCYACKSRGELSNEIDPILLHIPPGGRGSGKARNACTSLHARGGKGVWRQLLLYESCAKCQECSSLFARGSQIPTQGWQLGLFGENVVGWVFGVGSVATAGMMQGLKMQTRGVWLLTVMLQNSSLSKITASVRTGS